MKNLIFLLVVVVFASCNKYGFVNLNYPLNPQVYLPEHVKKIALVNRSLTATQDKQKNVVDAITSGEIAGSDKRASDECLKGVFSQLNGYRGINIIIPPKTRLYGTGTREIPEMLDWKLVKSICDSSGADVLLVLETFDSNSDVLLANVTNQVANVLADGNLKPNVADRIKVNVYCYWRMYDPSSKLIVDQYTSNNFMTFDGRDILLLPPEALPGAAYAAGEEYAGRFLPSYYTVRRDMYKRGKGASKQDFLAAFRRAEVANWQGAIEYWTKIAENNSRKNSGRACLNIAVGYEVLGNNDFALQWAKKAYEDYNDKLARSYVNALQYRKSIE